MAFYEIVFGELSNPGPTIAAFHTASIGRNKTAHKEGQNLDYKHLGLIFFSVLPFRILGEDLLRACKAIYTVAERDST